MKRKYRLKAISLMITTCFFANILVNTSFSSVSYTEKVISRDFDTWTTNHNRPSNRAFSTSSVLDDKIYVVGGDDGSYDKTNTYLNTMEAYDPKTDTWETKANMSVKRAYLTTSVVDGKIYAIGGYDGISRLKTVEVYDPKTNTWETKTNMPTGRSHLTSSVINGKIYCIGGYNGSYLKTVEVYDPKTDTWETKAPMLTGKNSFTSSAVDDKIYVIGGFTGSSRLNTLEVYDSKTNTWEYKANMPTVRSSLTSSVVHGKIYAIGGYVGTSRITTVEVYDPKTDTWETKPSMPTERSHLKSGVVNDTIYCIGGFNGSSYLNEVEAYTPKTPLAEEAEYAVDNAEQTRDLKNIREARNLVNQLPEGRFKESLQEILNNIMIDMRIDKKGTTGNTDVYIKSKNALMMTLSINAITFEDFSGVEDVLMDDAVEIAINSSLPYSLNAYLVTEIQNNDKSNTMNKEILQLKEDTELEYQHFNNINEKMILKDNCSSGDKSVHNIDVKLKGGIIHKADAYKTVIKFETEQK